MRLLLAGGALCFRPVLALGAGEDVPTYRVRRGDTLGVIARRNNTTVAELKRINQLKSDRIIIGQVLLLPHRSTLSGVAASSFEQVRKLTASLRVPRTRWKVIVAHHSAIGTGNASIYDAFHRRRGMENGLAYHFVIGNGSNSGDGEIEIGERWRNQLHGGHVRHSQTNQEGIGICLVGNFEERQPTSNQMAAFTELVRHLRSMVMSPDWKFAVHREIDGPRHTLCPGRHFPTQQMHRLFG